MAEYTSSGSLIKEYVYLHGQPVAIIKGGQRYYVHNDHLGRAERITNQSRSTVWQARNFAFDRKVITNAIGGYNLGFPGQYYDSEKQSWYNMFRDYDGATGRYLQSDPIGLAGGMNTYAYVGGNPLSYVDPYGLTEQDFRDIWNSIGDSYPELTNDVTPVSANIPFADAFTLGGGMIVIENDLINGRLNSAQISRLTGITIHELLHAYLNRKLGNSLNNRHVWINPKTGEIHSWLDIMGGKKPLLCDY